MSGGQQRGDRRVHVDPAALVEEGVVLGRGTRVWARAHLRRGASLGPECVVGDGVFVDHDVRIGARCKLQNNALIYHGSLIEDEVFVGPSACLTNDLRPRSTNSDGTLRGPEDWAAKGVTLRRGASVGAHTVVLAGVTVGEHAMVGAGAIVTADVGAYAVVAGNPARRLGWVCVCGAGLPEGLRCDACGHVYRRHGLGLQVTSA